MPDPTDRDRLVKLETQQSYQDDFNDQFLAKLGSIETEVKAISGWIQKKTGFIGGVMFCVGIIGALAGAAASHVWQYLTGHQ